MHVRANQSSYSSSKYHQTCYQELFRAQYLSSIPEKESRWFRMMPHILHTLRLGSVGSVAPNLNGKDGMTMGGTVKWVAKKNECDCTT